MMNLFNRRRVSRWISLSEVLAGLVRM